MVETRSQLALAEEEAQAAVGSTGPVPEWRQEFTRLQSEINRLEGGLDERFATMETRMMTNFQKLLEIGLGKRIDTSGLLEEPRGVLGQSSGGTTTVPTPSSPPIGEAPVHVTIKDEPAPNIREIRGQELNLNNNFVQTNNFVYKLLCPRFDGSDFQGWFLKLEQYFEAEAVPENVKVRLVMLHLEGRALQWHQYLMKSNGDVYQMRWSDYLNQMWERFAPGGFEDLFAELVALRQNDAVEAYYEEFINLINQVLIFPRPLGYLLLFKPIGYVLRDCHMGPELARQNARRVYLGARALVA